MFHGVRLAAACLLAAAAGVVPLSSAEAATCSSAEGVSVVVDFHELGGGVRSACVSSTGGDAAGLFAAAGFDLTRVQRQPGFVCRVAGTPSSDPCVNTPPADAYWGLWWSDGTSGAWTYATRGVDSQSVPEGGYVALSWNGSSARSTPGVSPAVHPAAPTRSPTPTVTARPTKTPKPPKTAKPTPGAPRPTPSTSALPTGSASASASDSPTAGASPSATRTTAGAAAGTPTTSPDVEASETPTTASSSATPDPEDPSDGGLPTWVGPVVVVLLFGAGGAVAVVRRRGNAAP